ncbi:uncharacterized protein LOC111272215 isoform X2 [Varroa jacobsoni]|uniref:uncharacterized protein LOC111272215 isoform X2 n=1 Tax=Varroa jacobsoni TaxID=62625 RepID=UPI000BF30F56|nr:uncharacterized protein LOC111272215 isoform X2 [Varroa jacobsoni]
MQPIVIFYTMWQIRLWRICASANGINIHLPHSYVFSSYSIFVVKNLCKFYKNKLMLRSVVRVLLIRQSTISRRTDPTPTSFICRTSILNLQDRNVCQKVSNFKLEFAEKGDEASCEVDLYLKQLRTSF